MQMFQAVTSASQVFWCIYSLALGSSADQEVLYKELCKCGEEKLPPNMLKE